MRKSFQDRSLDICAEQEYFRKLEKNRRLDKKFFWFGIFLWAVAVLIFVVPPTYRYINRPEIPKEVRIYDNMWRLHGTSESMYLMDMSGGGVQETQVSGVTDCDRHVIWYDVSDSDIHRTLWHEVFHAGGCAHGGDEWWNSINPTYLSHPGIYNLADFMTRFVPDNPEFIKWEENAP